MKILQKKNLLQDSIDRKFIESHDVSEWEVLTDVGFRPIISSNKTTPYTIFKLILSDGKFLDCADTHIVFLEDYSEVFVKDLTVGDIIHTADGLVSVFSISETDVQENMYDLSVDSEDHRFYTNGILSHNTTTASGVLLHYLIFNKNYSIGILANKAPQSREILSRVQLMYEYLPNWMQHGIKTWNKGDIELDNGSKAFTAATSASAIRGKSVNCLYLDEFAHVDNNKSADFFTSSYPTVSSGKTTKIIITSTPKGYNLFWQFWDGANKGTNGFVPYEAHYSEKPGNDEKWAKEQLAILGEKMYQQEVEMSFLGASGTLVNSNSLSRVQTIPPIFTNEKLDVFVEPIKDHQYVSCVDVSRGLSGDYSAITTIDVTTIPYQVVAKYKSNEITPLFFPSVIRRIAQDYNDSLVLIELNDAGEQVANILYNELEYQNLIFTYTENGKQIASLSDGKNYKPGVKTSRTTKSVGCSQLKILVEENKLTLNDAEILSELSTFVESKGSYAADSGYHDDLVMTLVLFGWFTSTEIFKFLGNENLRSNIYALREQSVKDSFTPYGIRDDGLTSMYTDSEGFIWKAKGDIETREDVVTRIKKEYGHDEDFGNWFYG